jgi:prepilin-type processing-associated H-X9-DG protein
LLVVIAIILILAAILFPVFAQAREQARQTSCLSNMRQIGMAVQMYVTDYDERMFFRGGWANSRSGNTKILPAGQSSNYYKWWNLLMPYIRNNNIFLCPSDDLPTPSADIYGNLTIMRSYIAVCPAESLTLAEVDDPAETIVVTEKWGKDWTGVRTDSWIEPFNGDFTVDSTDPTRMFTAANRHSEVVNCAFFDGHAKGYHMGDIQTSKDLTGCGLIYQYPFSGVNPPTVSSPSSQAGQPNICASFPWPAIP